MSLRVTAGGGLALLAGDRADRRDARQLLDHRGGRARARAGAKARGSCRSWSGCFVGAFTKSAQFPFHFWLPNAMQAPTPASAYLHSATMVKLGVYLLARFEPLIGARARRRDTLIAVALGDDAGRRRSRRCGAENFKAVLALLDGGVARDPGDAGRPRRPDGQRRDGRLHPRPRALQGDAVLLRRAPCCTPPD